MRLSSAAYQTILNLVSEKKFWCSFYLYVGKDLQKSKSQLYCNLYALRQHISHMWYIYNPITYKKRAGFNRAHTCMIPFLKMIYSRLLERTEYKIVPKVRQIGLLPIQKVQLLLRLFDCCSMSNRLCILLVHLLNVPISGTN